MAMLYQKLMNNSRLPMICGYGMWRPPCYHFIPSLTSYSAPRLETNSAAPLLFYMPSFLYVPVVPYVPIVPLLPPGAFAPSSGAAAPALFYMTLFSYVPVVSLLPPVSVAPPAGAGFSDFWMHRPAQSPLGFGMAHQTCHPYGSVRFFGSKPEVNQKPFVCDECSDDFNSPGALKHHFICRHNSIFRRKIKCHCGNFFRSKAELTKHKPHCVLAKEGDLPAFLARIADEKKGGDGKKGDGKD